MRARISPRLLPPQAAVGAADEAPRPDDSDAAQRMRALREHLQLSKRQWAEALAVDVSYVSLIERGKRPLSATLRERVSRIVSTLPKRLQGEYSVNVAPASPLEVPIDAVLTGPLLRKVRRYHGMLGRDLAQLLEVSVGYVHRVETELAPVAKGWTERINAALGTTFVDPHAPHLAAERATFRTRVRRHVLHDQVGHCESCGYVPPTQFGEQATEILQVSHIVPMRHGGQHVLENALLLCPNCHALASRYPDVFKRQLDSSIHQRTWAPAHVRHDARVAEPAFDPDDMRDLDIL